MERRRSQRLIKKSKEKKSVQFAKKDQIQIIPRRDYVYVSDSDTDDDILEGLKALVDEEKAKKKADQQLQIQAVSGQIQEESEQQLQIQAVSEEKSVVSEEKAIVSEDKDSERIKEVEIQISEGEKKIKRIQDKFKEVEEKATILFKY